VISRITLGRYGQPNMIIWRQSITDEFIVRSAYHLEQDRQALQEGVGSTTLVMSALWKTIWGMKVANPAKMFLWRACHNILQDSICQFCTLENETVRHILGLPICQRRMGGLWEEKKKIVAGNNS
jgi:hypothetical protein